MYQLNGDYFWASPALGPLHLTKEEEIFCTWRVSAIKQRFQFTMFPCLGAGGWSQRNLKECRPYSFLSCLASLWTLGWANTGWELLLDLFAKLHSFSLSIEKPGSSGNNPWRAHRCTIRTGKWLRQHLPSTTAKLSVVSVLEDPTGLKIIDVFFK